MTQTLAKIDNPITWEVYYKQNWTDSWSANDVHLVPTDVQFALAPTITRATIIRNFGNVKRLGISDTIVEPLDLTGKFIKIALSQEDAAGSTTTKNWYGYCPDPTDNYNGTRLDDDFGEDVSTGLTTYNCYGLEWFLRDTVVKTCIAQEPLAAVRDIVHERVIPFNFTDGDRYGKVQGNRSSDQNTNGIYEFSPDTEETWMGGDVVDHLLQAWYKQTGSVFEYVVVSGGNVDSAGELNNIEGSWDFDGENFHSSIFSIIGPSNAFSFSVTVNENVTPNIAEIEVYPTVSENVLDEDSNIIVSAITNKYVLDLDSDSQIANDGCSIQYLSSNHYDQIEVRGDWLRVAFSMATGNDVSTPYDWPRILKEGWSVGDEALYILEDDDGRRKEDYTSVYKRFVVDENWDGTTGENSETEALPSIDIFTGKVDQDIQQNFFQKNRIFDRTLPWTEIDNASQPRAPFVCWFDSSGKWYMLDNPSDDKTGLGLQMTDDQLGLKIVTGSKLNHITALDTFNETSEQDPELDYNNMFATVSLQTDERARVIVDAPDAEPGELDRVKVINMPQFSVWWICPNTIKSIDPAITGATGLVLSDAAGEYARDDSDKLLRAAILAKELYGRKRQILNINYASPFIDDMVGSFVLEVEAGQTTETVNTIISDTTYRLGRNQQQLVLKTSFFEFDLNRIFGRTGSKPGSGSRSFGRSRDELANIPVRFPNSGGAADESPISITYDADDNYYTITITALPYRLIAQQDAAIQDAAHTLLFHTPSPIKIKANQASSINLHFEYYPKVDTGLPTSDYHVLWSSNFGGVGYDEISTKVEIDSEFNGASHHKFQTILLQADGAGSELQISELYPVETSPRIANNSLQIVPTLSSNKIIRYSVTWTGFSCISGNNGSIGFSGFITTAIDDDIIIGFIASSNTERLDISANSGLYTDSSVVGHIKTVSDDGNLLLKQFYTTAPPLFPFFGDTSTWGITTTVGTRYFRFRNGILTQVTT